MVSVLFLWHLELHGCALLVLVSVLKKPVKLVCPGAGRSYVQPHEALLLGCRADGEGMPLVLGYCGDLDEHVVSRLIVEVGRTVDDQMCHLHGSECITRQLIYLFFYWGVGWGGGGRVEMKRCGVVVGILLQKLYAYL